MKEKIIIIGGKGTAVVIAEQLIHAIDKCNYDAEFLGFAFWDPSMTEVLGRPILFQDYEEMKKKYLKYDDVSFCSSFIVLTQLLKDVVGEKG